VSDTEALPEGYAAAGMKILCIDDDPSILELLHAVLSSEGHEVVFAATGAQALQLVLGREFDLVIADMKLPDLSGAEIIRATKAQAPGLPTLGISAAADPAVEAEALDAGVGRFLRKPFLVADLLSEVRLIDSLRGRLRLLLAGRLAGHRSLLNALRQEGFVVSLAPTAEAARAAVRSQPVDVVIARAGDEVGAEQFLGWKKTDPAFANVSVLAVTTPGQGDDQLLRDGASLCLPAPVEARTLATLLHFMDSPKRL
jgi:DNA-binding response OmpR family regulator